MYYWITVAVLLLVDQMSKLQVMSHLQPGESIPIIDGFLWMTYIQNRGAAFGIMQGRGMFFIVVSIIVVMAIIFYIMKQNPERVLQFIMGLITGGAVGNLIDRIRLNYVVDFFDLHWWPVFNIADMAIVIGGIILLIYFLQEGQSEETDG